MDTLPAATPLPATPLPPPVRVLFVDDEPQLLEGLRRLLRPQRHLWEATFAGSGTEALQVLEARPFDAIVSDVRMPDMDGARLLEEVRRRHPHVARIALSGHADRATVLRAIEVTHQYLTKPCDPTLLRQALERVRSLRRFLADPALAGLAARLGALPSLPGLHRRLMAECQSPDASLQAVAEIVGSDPGMTAKVLQLVNSAFFGLPRRVTSPLQAVQLIGLDTVRALALAAHVFRLADDQRGLAGLWEHSLATGVLARRIAGAEGAAAEVVEDAGAAGLLHDVGWLLICALAPAEARRVEGCRRQGQPSMAAEVDVLGATHAALGAYLLALWALPDAVVEAVALHHTPAAAGHQAFSTITAVHVADALVREGAAGDTAVDPPLDLALLDAIGLGDRLAVWRSLAEPAARSEA